MLLDRRGITILCFLALLALSAPVSKAQETEEDLDLPALDSPAVERFKKLASPKAKEERRKRAARPPFDFTRTQVSPNDVIPFTKPGHWVTLTIELQANQSNYSGELRSRPVKLSNMPHEITYAREVGLIQERSARPGIQAFFPRLDQDRPDLSVELLRPGMLRADGSTTAILQYFRPHQFLIPVLGANAPRYDRWNSFLATLPASGDREPTARERQRYYRFLHSLDPEKLLPLSPHPLCWTSISHMIWDDLNPELLNAGQQQALLDWLHWGGQLIICAGPGSSLSLLRESFLEPLLPAVATGTNKTLSADQLSGLVQAYPAPHWPNTNIPGPTAFRYGNYTLQLEPESQDSQSQSRPPSGDLFVTGLTPRESSSVIRLPGDPETILGVERRVGRGRILVLAFQPNDQALAGWAGLDTLVRTVFLKRPAETPIVPGTLGILPATSTSWLRYAVRDIPSLEKPRERPKPEDYAQLPFMILAPTQQVAAWDDAARIPRLAVESLEKSAGFKVPPRSFVITCLVAYCLLLVPLNWLVCRVLLRRTELAWIAAPLLAVAAAVGVERYAAVDMGFDRACDEIDIVEIQGQYPRAHVSRFASLYGTGRESYRIGFPDDPTALILPLSRGPESYQRGEAIVQSSFRSYPEPALVNFPVQPRSLALFRSEQMSSLPGGLVLIYENGKPRGVENQSGSELHDAAVVNLADQLRYEVGDLAPGAFAVLENPQPLHQENDISHSRPEEEPPPQRKPTARPAWLQSQALLEILEAYAFNRPEDRQEWRLVAWTSGSWPGLELTPKVDRHRAFQIVVAHLDYGPVPVELAGPPIAASEYDAPSPWPQAPGLSTPAITTQLGPPAATIPVVHIPDHEPAP